MRKRVMSAHAYKKLGAKVGGQRRHSVGSETSRTMAKVLAQQTYEGKKKKLRCSLQQITFFFILHLFWLDNANRFSFFFILCLV